MRAQIKRRQIVDETSEDAEGNSCPFAAGDTVNWVEGVPSTWLYIWTPGPMKVVSARYSDGQPSYYAKTYYFTLDFRPGWIITVEYDADSTDYYDPPLSVLLGRKRIRKEIHEMWLKKI